MQWEHLTPSEFKKAVEETGVCVIAMGVVEKHGDHLPPLNYLTPERQKIWDKTCETREHGHACECETSISLANHPRLVHMDRVKTAATALNRMKNLPPTATGIQWYSNYPEHYAGDARPATEAKGRILRGLVVDSLAEYLAAVKRDRVVPRLQQEFFKRME